MQTEDSYICDCCGEEYFFSNAYEYVPARLFLGIQQQEYYAIDGWHGGYDGQDMCSNCWDSY
jgi:hypothetical protein